MRVRKPLATAISALALTLALGAAPPSYNPPLGADNPSSLFPSSLFPSSYGAPRPSSPVEEPSPKPKATTKPKPKPAPTPVDPPVQRVAVQQPVPVESPALPEAATMTTTTTPASAVGVVVPTPEAPVPAPIAPGPLEGGQSISLQAALLGAIRFNPDLVALRNSNIASPEAVEVARRFPTTLNPTVWIDYRPITLIPRDTFANGTAGSKAGPFYHYGQNYILFSIRQPIELGHQTTHRHEIACAALSQQQWTVVQAELLAMVQTYRFFQTAAYRRERLRVARNLADSNERMVQSLKRRVEANQSQLADVVLAEVENEATRQLVDVARQDYANALADLRNQVGVPETAGTAEPLGEFVLPRNIPPVDENELTRIALCSRPEIHAARAAARGALAAIKLAQGDRIPTPVIGPQYAQDEAGIQYIGLVLVSALPVWNTGTPLVRQREADYRRALTVVDQIEKRTVIQVRAAAAKWNAANRLVNQTTGLTQSLRAQVDRMERLFEANQTDLNRLFQTRQRLIQLENAELDALWQATQAHADLLIALGAPNIIAALHEVAPAAPTEPPSSAPSLPTDSRAGNN